MPAVPPSFTLGLIQMRRTPSRRPTSKRPPAGFARRRDAGPNRLLAGALPLALLLPDARTPPFSTWPSPSPALRPSAWPRSRGKRASWSSASLFERRTAASITTRRRCWTRTAPCSASTARCTSPTTRSITRSTISRPATWVSAPSTTRFGRIGVLVCWDQWYPEGARLTALQGAEVLLYPTAIGWHPRREGGARRRPAPGLGVDAACRMRWPTAFTSRPSTASATRAPRSGGLEFWGASFVCDPFGQSLREASHDREEVARRRVRPAAEEEMRRNWPFLRNRRIDAYGDIDEAVDRLTDSVMLPSGAPYPGRSSIGTCGQTPRGRAVPVSDPYRPHKSVRSRYRCYRGSGR